ncbi:MAG TPA: hypothetical protein IAC67_05785 [Candidatus Coproplasma excrementipullorum]|nr:hypothetical protein [Candidatus Coproplasma excrementipullorum]
MANYRKKKTSGGAAVGIVALVLAFALVIVYVAVSLFKDSFNPLDWTSQSWQNGELNIDDGEEPGDVTDPDEPGEEPTDPDDPDEPGTDEPDEPDTPDVLFTIGDKTATDGNFSFSYTDEQVYSVVSSIELGDITVAVNPDIVEDLTGPRFPGLLTGNTYVLEGDFCMTEVMSAIFYVFQNNYVPFKTAADEYFNAGVPLCVITFENSDISFGILADVSDFATI